MNINVKQKNNLIFLLFVIGLSALLCVRDLMFISYNKWILVVYGCVFAVISPVEEILYMICFMLPLACGIPGTYLFLVFWGVLVIKEKRISPMLLLLLIYWICKEVVATFWVANPDIVEIIGYCIHIILFFFLIYDNSIIDYKKCINVYLIGTILLCAVIVVRTFLTAPSNWLWLFSNGWFRFGMADDSTAGMVLQLNANSLAYYCVVGIACGVMSLANIGTSKLIGILSLVICLFTGALTVSRSFLLIAGVILIVAVITMPKSRTTTIGIFAIAAIIAVVAIVLVQNYPELLEGFTARLTDKNMSTGGDRTILFQRYLDAFLANPRLFFTGTGVSYYKEITGIYNSMHNATEQIIVCYGIVGGLIFLISMLIPAFKIKRTNGKLIQWSPFFAVLLFVQTIQFVNPDMLMLPYIIAIYSLRIGSDIDEKISDNG